MKSRRGSAMVVVICTIGILWMIGLALSSLAVANLKVKKIEDSRKKAFYSAEAGLDQAYALTLKEVESAITDGNEYVKEQTAELIEDEKKSFVIGEDADYFNPDGSLKFDEVEAHFQDWFEYGFMHHFELAGHDMQDILKDYSYKAVSGYTEPPQITVKDTESYNFGESPTAEKKKELRVSLVSRFQLEQEAGKITRKLHANINIKVPAYDSSYSCVSNKVNAKVHPLFEKAITSDGNTVVDGSATVIGDVYAYGETGGGLLVGNTTKGSLDVHGNIISHNDVITKTNNSELTLNDGGYLYCSSLEIPSGTTGCDITVNGNVNTYDDVVLNGRRAKMFIDGTYYGFSDGSKGSLVDAGSSIVINSPDIRTESSIEITGKANPNADMNVDTDGNVYPESGVYIAGTVYVDGTKKYQTGESVSIKGNYLAYTKPLSGLYGDDTIYNSNNVIRRYYDSMELADEFISKDPAEAALSIYSGENTPEVAENKLNQQNKSHYLSLYNAQNPNAVNKGNGNVNVFNVIHSLGDYISQNRLGDSKIGDIGQNYEALKTNLFNFHTNWMNPSYASISTADTITALNSRGLTVASSLPDKSKSLNQFATSDIYKTTVFNKNADKPILLKGNGGGVPAQLVGKSYITIDPGTASTIQGAIFSQGDVYVTGSMSYIGTIASAKNVYIMDNNAKKFTASSAVVLKNLFDLEIDDGANRLSYVNEFRYPDFTGLSGNVFVTDIGTKELVYDSTASIGGITNYDAANQAIKLSDFYRVKN